MLKVGKYTLIVIMFFSSCRSNIIIPQKDMIQLLVKIHLIDATATNSNSRKIHRSKDLVDYYGKTIESFGYTQAQFDSSLSYYSKDPISIDDIYDKVIAELSKMETKIIAQNKAREDSTALDTLRNLWPLKPQWEIPVDGEVSKVPFELPVAREGVYTISADITVYPDDESVQPKLLAYFFCDDKSANGNKSVIKSTDLIKDGEKRNYKIKLELSNYLVTHLKGCLFEHSNTDQNFKKHASASDIKITFKPSLKPRRQDSRDRQFPDIRDKRIPSKRVKHNPNPDFIKRPPRKRI